MARVSDQPQRWSQAIVYPDMWLDPDEDPRDSAGVSPEGELATLQDDLTNSDPPQVAGQMTHDGERDHATGTGSRIVTAPISRSAARWQWAF